MLVRYFLELSHPAQAVEAALEREPEEWLPGIVLAASDHGLKLVSRVGLGVGDRRLDRDVTLSISSLSRVGDSCVVPISWRPAGPTGVYPALDGDIEISPLGPARAQLSISATYEPPLGWLGAAADRALLRRVAESTVKDFLDHVAAGVEGILAGEAAEAAGAAKAPGPGTMTPDLAADRP